MFKKVICTNHAIQRYEQRTNKTKQDIVKRMIRDIKSLRGKKIVKIGTRYHVFYKQPSNSVREFILEQDKDNKDKYYIITVISRSLNKSNYIYECRLKEKQEFESNNENNKED